MPMNEPTGLAGATGTWAIGCVMVCVAAAAMLFASRQPSESANVTAAETQQSSAATSTTRRGQPKTPVGNTTTQASMTGGLFAPAATSANGSDVELVPSAAQAPELTITGCLEERKDQTFRLTNTAGDAPKSRSWKSGFIKKGPTSIDLVDAANRMKLHSHVGEQITVSGVLADRELRVRSLKRVAKSCD